LIVTDAQTALIKFFIYRPNYVLAGNADTYHSIYVRIMSYFSVVSSLPTEQSQVVEPSLLNEEWKRYFFSGHGGNFKTAYTELDLIFSWGEEGASLFKEQLASFGPRIEPIGAIRSPILKNKPASQKSIGFIMDSFQNLLAMLVAPNVWKYHGTMSNREYFILSKIMESNFYSILPIVRDNFSDTKFIFRKRFDENSKKEDYQLTKFLDKFIVNYEFDSTSNLEYISNNSFAIISSASTAASEIQVLGVPSINVSNVLDSSFINRKEISENITATRPYNLAWHPQSEKELIDLIEKALESNLDVSPSMQEFEYYSNSVLGLNEGDPAENIIKYLQEEEFRLENKIGEVLDVNMISDAIKYHLLPIPFLNNLYKIMMNTDGRVSRFFWRIMLYILIIAKRIALIKNAKIR